jgi:3-oxoacyl-[acyl-carrier protein] reductase
MKLKDKIAIVTGGSQGIGEAICYSYAKEGAIVVVVNKSHPEAGIKVANKIKQEGGRAEALVCDIVNENSVKNLVTQVVKKYGRVDILVNNAGVVVFKSFEEQTLDDWNYVIDTNLKGLVRSLKI